MALAGLERLVDQEDIGKQRADMNRRVQIVDQLRAQRLLRQDEAQCGARGPRVLFEDRDKIGLDVGSRRDAVTQARRQTVQRSIRALEETPD